VGLIVLLFCLSDDWRPQAVLAVAVAILTVLELTSKLWALAAVFLTELTHYFHHSCVLWSGEGAHKDDREQPRQPAVVPAGEPVDNVAEDDDLRELELVPLVVRQPVAGGRQPDSELRLVSTTGVFKQLIWFVQATAALNAGARMAATTCQCAHCEWRRVPVAPRLVDADALAAERNGGAAGARTLCHDSAGAEDADV
jgi:hypothetical protein